ncbi:hypothetical protein IKQ26_06270 [bacterium]|nr:hypothetical protein [bacterium]
MKKGTGTNMNVIVNCVDAEDFKDFLSELNIGVSQINRCTSDNIYSKFTLDGYINDETRDKIITYLRDKEMDFSTDFRAGDDVLYCANRDEEFKFFYIINEEDNTIDSSSYDELPECISDLCNIKEWFEFDAVDPEFDDNNKYISFLAELSDNLYDFILVQKFGIDGYYQNSEYYTADIYVDIYEDGRVLLDASVREKEGEEYLNGKREYVWLDSREAAFIYNEVFAGRHEELDELFKEMHEDMEEER